MSKYFRILILAAIAPALSATAAPALLAPGAHDQIPAALVRNQVAATAALDRTAVHVAHAVDATQVIDAAPQPYRARSREFWTEVGENELRDGIKITVTAPGALIRLSPHGGSAAALDPAGILIRRGSNTWRADQASSAVADTAALRQAGMDVPDGTLALRLSSAFDRGALEIAAPHAQGRYLVHVFDAASAIELQFAADRDTVLAGSTLSFRAAIDGRPLQHASGLVTAPDGYTADLSFTRNVDGSFSAKFTPDAAHTNSPQLWEAHVFTAASIGNLSVLRDAKTAFAVSAPTARFSGAAQTRIDSDGVQATLTLDATIASRYQVSGVLYGTDANGDLRPLALGQSASWLDAGGGSIDLSFDADLIAASGLHAPFELRDLRLLDQANMSVIERRARALVMTQ
jgi:hypothetical protein